VIWCFVLIAALLRHKAAARGRETLNQMGRGRPYFVGWLAVQVLVFRDDGYFVLAFLFRTPFLAELRRVLGFWLNDHFGTCPHNYIGRLVAVVQVTSQKAYKDLFAMRLARRLLLDFGCVDILKNPGIKLL